MTRTERRHKRIHDSIKHGYKVHKKASVKIVKVKLTKSDWRK